MKKFGSVTIGHANTPGDLKKVIKRYVPDSETCIIKPNWYSPHLHNYTSPHALGMLIEALDRRVMIIEGHSWDRQDGSLHYYNKGKKIDWRYVLKNPDWEWFRDEGNLERLRAADQWFLDHHGFTELFEKYNAEYLNVTEEIWAGHVIDPTTVKSAVESKYSPVLHDHMYGFMPRKLASLKEVPLLSLGRVKGYGGNYPSLTMKNLFGLIPDPMRSWWHGPSDRDLSQNIVDITKIYATYFEIFGFCEAFESFTVSNPSGEVKVPWGAYSVSMSEGFYAMGLNLVELDAVLCGLMKVDPGNVGYIKLAREEIDSYGDDVVEGASKESDTWLPLLK